MPTDRRISCALTLLAALACAGAARAGVRLDKGWSRPVPAGLANGVIYGVLVNDGPRPDRLLSVSTPVAKAAELHETMRMNGPMGAMSHMAPLQKVDVPAHGRAALAPDGRHVMLLGLAHPLRTGERVPVTLTFQHAGRVAATVRVQPTAP